MDGRPPRLADLAHAVVGCFGRVEHEKRQPAAHRALDLGGTERNRACLAGKTQHAQSGSGKQPVDHAAKIGRHGHLCLEGAGKQVLRRRLVDM